MTLWRFHLLQRGFYFFLSSFALVPFVVDCLMSFLGTRSSARFTSFDGPSLCTTDESEAVCCF